MTSETPKWMCFLAFAMLCVDLLGCSDGTQPTGATPSAIVGGSGDIGTGPVDQRHESRIATCGRG